MPNSLGPLGLTTATQAELLAQLTASYQTIYGADINLGSDTPDGQTINEFIQVVLDDLDLQTQIYNSFDPDNAVGVVLDQRVALNLIQRQGGTFTVTNITVITGQSVNLYGLDQTDQQVYTLSDNAGNLWQLQNTQLAVSTGSNVFTFQAAIPGAVLTTPNTITVQVTIVLGVVSVNNPTTFTTLGVNQESDALLRLRRQASVGIGSQGYYRSLKAALENINGVTNAFIYENFGSTTDANGVPGHSIWVIVAGSGAPSDIAAAIYTKRNAGCGMFGTQTFTVTQINGLPFIVSWDDVSPEDLYIEFDASPLDGINVPDVAALKAGLVANYMPDVAAEVNINQLATLVQQINSNVLVTNAGFSTSLMGTYTNTLTPAAKNNQFDIQAANITITLV